MSDDNFLSRWSKRKHQANREPALPAPPVPPPLPAVAPPSDLLPAESEIPPEPLPSVDSLTPESDFKPFMNAEVDPETRRQALKTLFSDPRFNVMDGLDVYIDDYSKPDPLPAGWLEKMHQFAYLGDRGQRDRDEAARAEADSPREQTAQSAENFEQKQVVAIPGAPPPSDTSDGISPPPELPESAGKAAS